MSLSASEVAGGVLFLPKSGILSLDEAQLRWKWVEGGKREGQEALSSESIYTEAPNEIIGQLRGSVVYQGARINVIQVYVHLLSHCLVSK